MLMTFFCLFECYYIYSLQENNNTKNDQISLEDYITSTILRSSDAINTHKYSEMILLIRHILKLNSKLDGKIIKQQNFISNNVFLCDILERVESTSENTKVSFTLFDIF